MGFRMELNGQEKQIDTRHVDKLAKEGIVMDQYYVQCVCSPSRVTFLTGRYPLHHGINVSRSRPPVPFSSLAQFQFRQAAPEALPAAAASPRVRHNSDRVC